MVACLGCHGSNDGRLRPCSYSFDGRLVTGSLFSNAEGLRVGSDVVYMGIRTGSVKSIELDDTGKIILKLSVLKRYVNKFNSSVVARSGRTFVIGDKVITLALNEKNAGPLDPK